MFFCLKLIQITFDSCSFMLFPHGILEGFGTGLAQEHPLQTPMSSRYASCTWMHLGMYGQWHVFSKSNPKRTGGIQGKHISSGLACSSSSLQTLCSPRVPPCLSVSPRVSPCLSHLSTATKAARCTLGSLQRACETRTSIAPWFKELKPQGKSPCCSATHK